MRRGLLWGRGVEDLVVPTAACDRVGAAVAVDAIVFGAGGDGVVAFAAVDQDGGVKCRAGEIDSDDIVIVAAGYEHGFHSCRRESLGRLAID
jgi:hypothetical protein